MKVTDRRTILGLIVIAWVVAGGLTWLRPAPRNHSQPGSGPPGPPVSAANQVTSPGPGATAEPAGAEAVRPVPESPPEPPLQDRDRSSVPRKPNPVVGVPPGPAGRPAPPPDQDEMARVALSFVGVDRAAELYWVTAINDPDLSDHERQNLIEDLNEEGISDPKHPTPADLPMIINRLRLIEELAPYAIDRVNFDAFAEAYKDLVNLADVATGGGEPVK